MSTLRVRRSVIQPWLVVAILVSLLSLVLGYTIVGALNAQGEMKKRAGSMSQTSQSRIYTAQTDALNVTALVVLNLPGLPVTAPAQMFETPALSEPVYTNVTVTPYKVVASVGQTFNVEVWINNVTGMAGWEVKLYWNKNIVKCLRAHVNTPAEWGGAPFDWFNKTVSDVDPIAVYTAWLFGSGLDNEYNATHGQYFKAECFGPRGGSYHNTFNGSLAIVTFAFEALQEGSTPLGLWKCEPNGAFTSIEEFEGIKIGNRNAQPIPSVVFQGFVEVETPTDQTIVPDKGE